MKEKLAKALEYVALGDLDRLRHHVSNLAEHLNDDSKLVRYHLCTALVVIGCEHPKLLTEGRSALVTLLDDENAYSVLIQPEEIDENPYNAQVTRGNCYRESQYH